MARLFIDGFDHGMAGALWDTDTGVYSNSSSLVTGQYSITITGIVAKYLEKEISASASVYTAHRVYHETGYNAGLVISFYDSSSNLQGYVDISSIGGESTVVTVYDSSDVSQGDYTFYYSYPHTYHVQARLTNSDATNKIIQVKIDNVLQLNESFANSSADSATTSKVRFALSISGAAYIDDVVMDDAAWPGAPEVHLLVPSSDGITTSWSPSSGSDHYSLVDEIPANETDYVETTTSDAVDKYELANLSDVDDWSPFSVQLSAYAKTPGAPEDEYLQLLVTSGGSDYLSASKFLSTSYGYVTNIWDSNPNTSAEWTEQQINNLGIGIKAKSS